MQSETEVDDKIHPNFLYGQVRYNILTANWRECKPKPQIDLESNFFNQNYPKEVNKKSIYTFAPTSADQNKATLYSLNLVTEQIKEWQFDKDANVPMLRQSYGFTSYEGNMCIFGGEYQNQYFNDLHSFSSYINVWKPIIEESNPVLPDPRVPLIFNEISHGKLLLIGGCNQNGLLKDAYLLKNMVWKKLGFGESEENLRHFNNVMKLDGFGHCLGLNCIYIFGGNESGNLSNDFYSISVDEESFILKIEKIISDRGPRPCPRAYHSMQKLGETTIAVYGGSNGKNLQDISVYDFIHDKWFEVYPLNGPLPLLIQPKILFDFSSLFMFGNLKINENSKKCLVELHFSEFDIIKSEICSNCVKRMEIKEKEDVNGPKKPFISNGLLYNMAAQIKFPFEAFSLLLDCAESLKSTEFSVKCQETIEKLPYFDIRFNGISLDRHQFSSLCSHSYIEDPLVLQIIDRLKYGALRLGKTFVYISINGEYRRVLLFSADGLVISHYDEVYGHFAFEERIKDDWLSSQESVLHKKHIYNLLKSYFASPEKIINSVQDHCILIFENNTIMTNEKNYYSELFTTETDIILCKNQKKAEFLDSFGFKLQSDPEVSLVNYLSYSRLSSPLVIKIQSTAFSIAENRYLNELNLLFSQKIVFQSVTPNLVTYNNIEVQTFLYDVSEPNSYYKELKGILVYYRGRLINRLEINFGDLFWQKFYKNRFKKTFGIWCKVGVINFVNGVEPKVLMNEFKNTNNFSGFMRTIKKEFLKTNRPEYHIDCDEPKKRKISHKS